MTDFELPAIKAFKSVWPDIEPRGCFFHLCQSHIRQIAKKGLKVEYENTETGLRHFVKSICALVILPATEIFSVFEQLLVKY